MVEITPTDISEMHYVRGDIQEFVSPLDGTAISGRRQYEEHCRRYNVVPTESLKGLKPSVSVVEQTRERQALRERLWEYTDKSMRGRRCAD